MLFTSFSKLISYILILLVMKWAHFPCQIRSQNINSVKDLQRQVNKHLDDVINNKRISHAWITSALIFHTTSFWLPVLVPLLILLITHTTKTAIWRNSKNKLLLTCNRYWNNPLQQHKLTEPSEPSDYRWGNDCLLISTWSKRKANDQLRIYDTTFEMRK